ncbi:hypothetical protein N836_34075 [Leptolyngbya sp. Heron Island J]|uniref:hypothetical protein n=1 Tax=Leptolyngbya sp. Heron Island J TaxID=1385935 RepID=UPI0003B9662D|nr:hypothetical protein [Leptolyngbya sp. Heron Island J]ESA38107.1 hypothetical protein N836_34075 [Leptolyngbya sp. Heron Island J]
MRFLDTDIFDDAKTGANGMEKVLLQLLTAYYYIANGVTFKLREALGSDSGNEPVISWNGPYKAADGTTRITVVAHFLVSEDALSPTYSGLYQAAEAMTTSDPAAAYVGD